MTSQHETGPHSFLWLASMRQDHIHFSWAYIYSYIYTSQNKCFSIFMWHLAWTMGPHNYGADLMADDILEYPEHKDRFWLDVHHYFNWPAMCNVYAEPNFIDIPCVCSANIPNTSHQYEQGAWAAFMKKGLLKDGYRLYIGEWSAGLQVARNCNNPTKLPNAKQAQVMWRAQKLSFLSQYLHYKGLAAGESSFLGEFYWGRSDGSQLECGSNSLLLWWG